VYRIKQVILFGSYLGDSPTFGDVDLAVSLEFRYDDARKRERQSQERIEYALRKGKSFRTPFEQVSWPYQEVFTILKGRSPTLSLHDVRIEQILSQPIPSKVLFDATLDKS
jgi:predicted nucleotidyltransferase